MSVKDCIEKRARALLASEYDSNGWFLVGDCIRHKTATNEWQEAAVRAIVVALTAVDAPVSWRHRYFDKETGVGFWRYSEGEPQRAVSAGDDIGFEKEPLYSAAGITADARVTAAESRLGEVEAGVLALIPTNWCDPMLTGDTAALGPNPWGCPDIERLLGAIRNRITDFFKGAK